MEIVDNPLVAVTLWFKDGAALRQVFTNPIPQSKAMPVLGRTVAELGGELNIQLEPIFGSILQVPKTQKVGKT